MGAWRSEGDARDWHGGSIGGLLRVLRDVCYCPALLQAKKTASFLLAAISLPYDDLVNGETHVGMVWLPRSNCELSNLQIDL